MMMLWRCVKELQTSNINRGKGWSRGLYRSKRGVCLGRWDRNKSKNICKCSKRGRNHIEHYNNSGECSKSSDHSNLILDKANKYYNNYYHHYNKMCTCVWAGSNSCSSYFCRLCTHSSKVAILDLCSNTLHSTNTTHMIASNRPTHCTQFNYLFSLPTLSVNHQYYNILLLYQLPTHSQFQPLQFPSIFNLDSS